MSPQERAALRFNVPPTTVQINGHVYRILSKEEERAYLVCYAVEEHPDAEYSKLVPRCGKKKKARVCSC